MAGENLRIKSIELKNFRPYEDVIIEFSQDKKKSFTIIEGNNSAGKTSLINAMYWCLYGKEQFLNVGEGKKKAIIEYMKRHIQNENVHIRHYGSLKGINEFEQCDAVILLGTPFLPEDEVMGTPEESYIEKNKIWFEENTSDEVEAARRTAS